jgi:hypothetical protein
MDEARDHITVAIVIEIGYRNLGNQLICACIFVCAVSRYEATSIA